MEAPYCDGCPARDARLAEQDARIAALEEEVRQLKALLGRNASNSSTADRSVSGRTQSRLRRVPPLTYPSRAASRASGR